MLLLIDNYDSFTYNLVQYLGELGAEVITKRNDSISVCDAVKMNPSAIMLSPGPSTPRNAGICLNLTLEAAKADIPLMGVCLGHQTIGEAFGGTIVCAKSIMHGKTSLIEHSGKGLFKGIPSPFKATRYHSLMVSETQLPDCLKITARVEDGTIMGLQHREKKIFGVQFHPESIASEYGHKMIQNFLSQVKGF
jgi:anthranilate synthase component 2